MKIRATQLVAAVVVGLAANLAMVSLPGAKAQAEECLAGPKGPAPQGSHWYYRVDRATKRNCWYVRAVGQKPAQSATTASTLPDVAATTQPAKPTAGAPLQPSVANARAEYSPARDGRNLAAAEPATAAASGSSAFNGAQDSDPQAAAAQRWSLASRWSDQGEAGNVNNGPSSTEEAADQPAAIPHNARSVPLTNAPTATAPPVQSTINSIWMLLGALVGALALAGGLVGTIVKLGSGPKPTVRRDINGRPDIWGAALSEGKQSASRSPIIDEPECFQPPMNWIKVARERHSAQSQSDEIERLLARAPRRSA